MLCNHCGSQIDDDAMFCPVCGKAVTGGETARPAAGTAFPKSAEEKRGAVEEKRISLVMTNQKSFSCGGKTLFRSGKI